MGHHAATPAHAGHMDLVHPGELQYGAHVVGIDAGPRHQAGTPRQGLGHGLQRLQPCQGGRSMAGAQDAFAPRPHYHLQIRPPVAAQIDGAVKGDPQGAGRRHQLPQPVSWHPPLRVEQADHHPLQAGGAGGGDVLQHQLELEFAKAEIPGPGTDHGIDGNTAMARRLLHQAIGRGEPAEGEGGAELDTIGPGILGDEQGLQVVDADFETGHDISS